MKALTSCFLGTFRSPLRLMPLLLVAAGFGLASAAAGTSAPPNVILIMTDDQGYGDFGFNGNPLIRTPHLDAMAQRSARLENFYVSPVCSPTRACLMTGRYNYRTRCIDTYVGRSMMEPKERTIAELLRDAGYATAIFGKWHLGDNYPMRPMDQGFEESLVLRGGGIGQPADPAGAEGQYTDPILFHNGKAEQMHGFCTDIYFGRAGEYIEKCAQEQRPFFVYIADNCPHAPFHDVPGEEYGYYKDLDLSNDQFPQEKGHPLPDNTDTDRRARIYAMITNIDENIGRLFERLERLNLTRKTMVVFLVDNGPNGPRYVAGLRGRKSDVYEGGIRSPLLVQWPGRLEPGVASSHIAAHIDLLPTILDACEVSPPEDLQLDGQSLLPLLTRSGNEWPERKLFIQTHRGNRPVRYHHFAARSENWKLVHPSGFGRETFAGPPRFELYHMATDPWEKRNVAAEHPQIVEELKEAYDRWFDDVSHTRPDNYAPPRIFVGSPRQPLVTLTRQDWRHLTGRPWGRNSHGKWLVRVVSTGTYQVKARFHPPAETGAALHLQMGTESWRQPLEANARQAAWEIRLEEKGDTEIQAFIESGEETWGVLQLDLQRATDHES